MLYIYIATFLLIIGVFCFIYASFSPKKTEISHKPKNLPKKRKNHNQKNHNVYQKPVTQKPKYDDRIIRDRRLETFSNAGYEPYVDHQTYSENEISGLLYLDYLKRIPYHGQNIKQLELKEEMFCMIKRIGLATAREHSAGFNLFSLNSQYNYNFSDVESILFYDEGFIITSNKSEYPTAIFLTKNVDSFKEILQKR